MPKRPTTPPDKRPEGRPSKYRAAYCDMLVAHMSEGQSVKSFGSVVGVCADTVFEWAKAHPEFSDAKKRGESAREKFLIGMGLNLIRGEMGLHASTTAWIFMCKNMLGWRDKQDLNVGGQAGGVPVDVRGVDMTQAQRLQRIKEYASARKECGYD